MANRDGTLAGLLSTRTHAHQRPEATASAGGKEARPGGGASLSPRQPWGSSGCQPRFRALHSRDSLPTVQAVRSQACRTSHSVLPTPGAEQAPREPAGQGPEAAGPLPHIHGYCLCQCFTWHGCLPPPSARWQLEGSARTAHFLPARPVSGSGSRREK